MRILSILLLFQFSISEAQTNSEGLKERKYLINTLTRIADPVLNNLSKQKLKVNMLVEAKVSVDRTGSTYLEAFGRLLSGMAPWLELGPDNTEEGRLREKYILLAVSCIDNATNPASTDFMNFNKGAQPLVDAAFFAQALVRAPKQLWGRLKPETRKNTLEALRSSRVIQPPFSNWLMFSAMVEAALQKFDQSGDKVRIDYAIRQHLQWYKGDGAYGDGPNFHWDYYNSFVIQPMLLDVAAVLKEENPKQAVNYNLFLTRSQRYAEVQERLISPEGTFPPIGRSLAYRFGAFQLLSQIALKEALPAAITPQQVRFALYNVIKRQIEMPGTFDKNGWLQIGFAGHQPEIGESYISTGSLYLCSEAFLYLGLPPENKLWTAPDEDWTSRKAWKGQEFAIDHALKDQ